MESYVSFYLSKYYDEINELFKREGIDITKFLIHKNEVPRFSKYVRIFEFISENVTDTSNKLNEYVARFNNIINSMLSYMNTLNNVMEIIGLNVMAYNIQEAYYRPMTDVQEITIDLNNGAFNNTVCNNGIVTLTGTTETTTVTMSDISLSSGTDLSDKIWILNKIYSRGETLENISDENFDSYVTLQSTVNSNDENVPPYKDPVIQTIINDINIGYELNTEYYTVSYDLFGFENPAEIGDEIIYTMILTFEQQITANKIVIYTDTSHGEKFNGKHCIIYSGNQAIDNRVIDVTLNELFGILEIDLEENKTFDKLEIQGLELTETDFMNIKRHYIKADVYAGHFGNEMIITKIDISDIRRS